MEIATQTSNHIDLSFLPFGFDLLKTEKAYWKMSQMKEGDNKLRIMQRPISGWLDWHDKKPMRYKPNEKPKNSWDPEKPIKAFWTCYVWDYARESMFILEMTQSSILKALTGFAMDSEWGDFTEYDIKITKEGSGKDSRYSVKPCPHKSITEKMKTAHQASPVRLEALYEGKDPWTDLDGEVCSTAFQAFTPVENKLKEMSLDEMKVALTAAFPVPNAEESLMSYLVHCEKEPRRKISMSDLADGWIKNPESFLQYYKVFCEKQKVDKIMGT